jgi:uncharacterized protein (TIGR03067 family)
MIRRRNWPSDVFLQERSMPRRLLFILWVLVSVGPVLARGDDKATEVVRKLQGEWEGVEIESNGAKGPEASAKAFLLTFQGDEVLFHSPKGGRGRRSTFKLDPTKSPMEIDLTPLDGFELGMTQRCIFSIDKDRLRLCVHRSVKTADQRPTEFKTKADDGLILVSLKRVESK